MKIKLKVKTPFKWAHQGVEVEEFEKNQVIETEDADLIRVATDEGWVVKLQQGLQQPEQTQAHTAAPEQH